MAGGSPGPVQSGVSQGDFLEEAALLAAAEEKEHPGLDDPLGVWGGETQLKEPRV